MPFSMLGTNSLPVVVSQPDEKHAKRNVLCWSDMTDNTKDKEYIHEKVEYQVASYKFRQRYKIRGNMFYVIS